ncbi:MAG: peptidase M75 superfamily protein [Flavobacteriales bacterium]|nr:peptidase M75 superfamily protein [Candidatus Arcticimaribacter sp.]
MKKLIYLKLVILSLIFQGCSGDSDTIEIIEKTDQSNVSENNSKSTNEFDRSSMLTFWADSIILPSMIGFENELNVFNEYVENFTANPNANNLTLLRDQWLTTYKNWQYVEMFDLGIAEEIYFKNRMNIFPANVQRIESNISNQEFNLDESANFAAQGFTALDYLLFGVEQEDDVILTKYSDTSSNYGDYLIQVTAKMQELTVLVKAQWEGDYRDSFVQSTENTATSSINMMLNDFVYYYEKGYRANKFGIPAGVFSGGPLPNTIEAYHGEIYSKILSLEATNAIENFFNGVAYNDPETLGPSIKDYLDFVESDTAEKLSERINEKLQGGRIKINELNTSFIKQIEENNTLMLLTYDAIQSAVILFKVDMLQKLNVSVDYADADGD